MNADELKKVREICETAEWNLRDNGDIGIEFIEFVRTALPAALGEIERLQKENEIMSEALEKLSRLGAGDRLGNSDGNCIAQRALKEAKGDE